MAYIEPVAAYIRVSTAEQKLHGLSLDAQKVTLTAYADRNNLKIVEWYMDEGITARKEIRKRPELQRMINDAKTGRFSRIIFIKLDRYFRSVAEYHECQKILDAYGVTWTATEEKYDLSTANGRAFVNMKLTIAELEADQTGERINLVNEYKVKTGKPLTGSLPFCFTCKIDAEKGKIVVKNPETEALTEDLIAYYLRFQSVSKTMQYINAKYGANFSYNTVYRTLKTPLLCGQYKTNPHYCEGYIDRNTYDKLQIMLNRQPRTATNKKVYIFSGLLTCPECGRRLIGSCANPRGKEYRHYRCSNHRKEKKCDFSKTVSEENLEKLLLRSVESILNDVKIASVKASTKQQTVVRNDVEALQKELDRLNYTWQKGRISVEEYDRKYDALIAKIDDAKTEAKKAPADFSAVEAVLTSGWKNIYNALDAEHKQAFWKSFIKNITVDFEDNQLVLKDIVFF